MNSLPALLWLGFLISVSPMSLNTEETFSVCRSPVCVERGNLIKQYIDPCVDPCDDFYSYACGGWFNKTSIPDDLSRYGAMDILHAELQDTLKGLLENITLNYETTQNITDKAAIAYNACVAVPEQPDDRNGILDLLNRSGFGEWPITEVKTLYNNWADVVLKAGINTFLSFGVGKDRETKASHIIQIDQMVVKGRNQILHPNATEYNVNVMNAYKVLIKTAIKFIRPNISEENCKILADEYMDFERQLVNLTTPPDQRGDLLLMYHRTNISTLETNFSVVEDLVKRLRDIFNETLEKTEWMEPSTRANASEKLKKMTAKIGYQPWLLNTTVLEILGRYIPIFKKNDTFFRIWFSIMRNNFAHSLLLLRQSYNKTAEWTVGPTVVNAFYTPDKNEMSYPSAILQGLFYTEGLPRSISFGGIGSVVGHELNHGFDNVGRQFDSYGELRQWWTNTSLINFERKAMCFVYQYGNICDAQAQMKLNGFNTVNENIADNEGVRTAYKAYERYFTQDCQHKDIRLEGLEELSGRKLFFISHAMMWCTLSRTQELKNQIQYDVHSPEQYRINVALQNMREFSHVFNCSDGARMNPNENETCKLW